jgi:predicted tellurium resistance membrane protein TerC
MDWLTDPSVWISLLTLTVLEIVLGVDNIIFITILAGKLPPEQRGKARTIGLMLALITRVILLSLIFLITQLTKPAFVVHKHEITWKGIILIAGGLFLIFKSVREVHTSLEGDEHEKSLKVRAAMGAVIAQIVVIDIVFSLDSVITAVGLAQKIGVMITAVILAMLVMLWASEAIGNFVDRHPTIKMLALSFLLLVGVVLVADGLGHHIEKGYIYFAMAFSFGVEMLNLKMRAARQKPVELRKEY